MSSACLGSTCRVGKTLFVHYLLKHLIVSRICHTGRDDVRSDVSHAGEDRSLHFLCVGTHPSLPLLMIHFSSVSEVQFEFGFCRAMKKKILRLHLKLNVV